MSSSTFDSAVPSELCQLQWYFLGLLVNACGHMQGTEEWDHLESLVNLEDMLLPARLSHRVLVSQSSQAGFLCGAPAPVPHI